jgi:small subunit ribosomal protein S21
MLRNEVNASLVQVIVKPGEPIDVALKRFKKTVMNSGITKEARMHERYEKPSDRKRRELKAAVRKFRRAREKAAARDRS